MLELFEFYRGDNIFNEVSKKVKSTKWRNIDPVSPITNSEELLAIVKDNTLIGYIHIEDTTEEWEAYENLKSFGITKFFIFPEFQNQGNGKEAALALFRKQREEGYTNIIMQVESGVAKFWDKVIESQPLFPVENFQLVRI